MPDPEPKPTHTIFWRQQPYVLTDMNSQRAEWAEDALAAFRDSCVQQDSDLGTSACDLICDLLHMVSQNRGDPLAVLCRAIRHFNAEASGNDDLP